jgi:predicted PurR-regulated permease PerM
VTRLPGRPGNQPASDEHPQPGALGQALPSVPFSPAARWIVGLAAVVLIAVFVRETQTIVYPFIWAVLAAYLLMPAVNFVNYNLRLPRLLVVVLLYILFLCVIVAGSRYLLPWLSQQIKFFILDLPRLEGALIHRVGTHPLGIDVPQLIAQVTVRLHGLTRNPSNAEKLLRGALSFTVHALIFLFTTFYLLMDGPRIRRALIRVIPRAYQGETLQLAQRINSTWTQYIRGELILFGIMATASFIGLEILRVPGAVPLALATGVLELLPLVGPFTAGTLAVSVAYLSPHTPFGWSPEFYGVVVALMYLLFRETEDYIVVPRVLGRAVRLHPLVILFALSSGAILFGILGLLIAVPVAASVKIIAAYLFDKVAPGPPEFADVYSSG